MNAGNLDVPPDSNSYQAEKYFDPPQFVGGLVSLAWPRSMR
jgi:hypothetical protein